MGLLGSGCVTIGKLGALLANKLDLLRSSELLIYILIHISAFIRKYIFFRKGIDKI